ncbi:MAG: hypothetical protein KJ587_10640 [Alphaproteobacteria bacterium]|nr:hypothetical protein [Alphaproteobacteria bacterium]
MAAVAIAPLAHAADAQPPVGIAPLTVKPNGDDATIQTSVGQWESYFKNLDQQKIEDAKRLAPVGLTLPKPPPASTDPLEIWSKADVKGLGDETAVQGINSAVGAAVRLGDGLKFGIGTELDNHDQHKREINRAELQVRLAISKWTLLPQAAIVAETTTTDSIEDSQPAIGQYGYGIEGEATQSESTRLEFRQELRRPFRLEDGEVLEPFVNFSTSIGLDRQEAAQTTPVPVDTVGVGVSLSRDSDYKLQATTDVDGLGKTEPPGIKSRLQLNVPLN